MSQKKLGQHFLNSIYIARKIVNFAKLKNEIVVEIGAGKGMLTREIARQARYIYAIEIDPLYVSALIRKNIPNVLVINANFLNFDLTSYRNAVIVGNIPYSITTKIIEKLVRERDKFLRAVLTIQKEYGERLLAKPDSPKYSSISCYVNYYFNIIKGFNIPPKFFTPAPSVSSMLICLDNKELPFLLEDEKEFFEFVKGVFRYRRKILKNSLLNYLGYLPDYLDKKILLKRPEQLELIEFFELYKNLKADNISFQKNN